MILINYSFDYTSLMVGFTKVFNVVYPS